jgi:23S rRNA U2552 (ribose-2'-O)-methylase RlmE/FtsJ
MARSKSSQGWLKEHFDDPYVKKAQQAGHRLSSWKKSTTRTNWSSRE